MSRLRRLPEALSVSAGLLMLIIALYAPQAHAEPETTIPLDEPAPEALPLTDEANSDEESDSNTPPAPAKICYLSIEYHGSESSPALIRVEVDENESKIFQTGDRLVKRYAEGEHSITIRRPKGRKKQAEINTFSVELRPFAYTKILIDQVTGTKKPTVTIMVLQDGSVTKEKRLEL